MIIPALPVEQNVAMVELFEKKCGHAPRGFAALPQAGSSRRYIRLLGETENAIGAWGHDAKENAAFIRWAKFFAEKGIRVPEVYGEDLSKGIYLLEDLGDNCLLDDRIAEASKALGENTKSLYQQAIDQLINIQQISVEAIVDDWFYPVSGFEADAILQDLRYGQFYFIKPMQIPFSAKALEKDFQLLANDVANAQDKVLMIRDFQARNLMVKDKEIVCIDFQGMRKGPRLYDLISLLYQAKAKLTAEDREALLSYYEQKSPSPISFQDAATQQAWQRLKLIRFLQVLGAYGYRGLFEKKPHFLASIPEAVANIREILGTSFDFSRYPALHKVLLGIARIDISPFILQPDQPEKLNVRIGSFSYRRGLPVDPSGNGGGFIFDCRFVYNPGRQAAYRSLTGMDQPVQTFLMEETEMPELLECIEQMVMPAVEKYKSRNFQNLMISFGCTGGQHRSVFAANTIAAKLRAIEGVHVILEHRERRHWPALA